MVAAYTARAESFIAERPPLVERTDLHLSLFQVNMDLAPDGKRFAVFLRPEATGEQKGSVHVTFLLNFFDELRRRVPVSK